MDPKDRPGKVRSSRRLELIEETVSGLLAGTVKFVPDCSPKTYTVNVTYRILVKDCDIDDVDEAKAMGAGLQAKGQSSADAICSLNGDCKKGHLVGVTITRNQCIGRQWDVDAQWTFECVP